MKLSCNGTKECNKMLGYMYVYPDDDDDVLNDIVFLRLENAGAPNAGITSVNYLRFFQTNCHRPFLINEI